MIQPPRKDKIQLLTTKALEDLMLSLKANCPDASADEVLSVLATLFTHYCKTIINSSNGKEEVKLSIMKFLEKLSMEIVDS